MMTLSVNDQLRLLHDLLDEQMIDNTGSIAEYQQIKRLIKEMIAKDKISDDQLLKLLPEIYNYGRQGEIAQSSSEHITTNTDNIENWKNAIEQFNLE